MGGSQFSLVQFSFVGVKEKLKREESINHNNHIESKKKKGVIEGVTNAKMLKHNLVKQIKQQLAGEGGGVQLLLNSK